jgi:MFS family permease
MSSKKYTKKEQRIQKSLRYSIYDGVAYSGMNGFGASYIKPFAVALNATAAQIGFLSSFPELVKALFQLHTIEVTDKTKNRKKVVLISTILQAIVWLPMFLIPYLLSQNAGVVWLIILACVYYIMDGFGAPPWISWMGDLVPENNRGGFFSKRNRLMGLSSFLSVLAAGLLLDYFALYYKLIGFLLIFFVAFLFRSASAFFIKKMHEPKYEVYQEDVFSFVDFVKRLRGSNFGVFVLYLSLFSFGVSISSPFFVVFMFRELNFTYAMYTGITAVHTIVSALTVSFWGKNGDKFGNKTVFSLTGYLIPLLPILWVINQNYIFLLIVSAFGGFVWAGFTLTSTNFIFDTVSPRKRARCAAYYNLFMGVSNFAGAILGGLLVNILPTPMFFISNIQILLLLSGVLRFTASAIFLPRIKEPKETKKIRKTRLLFNIIAYEPMQFLSYQSTLGFSRLKRINELRKERAKKSAKSNRRKKQGKLRISKVKIKRNK